MPTVGERIREIRLDLDLNQDQLADRAGLSKGFLSDVENNKRNIGSESLLKLANVLGASVDYLLRGEVSESVTTQPTVIPPSYPRPPRSSNFPMPPRLSSLKRIVQ